ncbi:MAG: hypothetical protein ACYS8W_17295 [Planctomycetota bacterium]|jgi:hypothetical protein
MKLSLPLKLGIAVVIIFGVTIAACLLYKPLKIRWYESKLDAEDVETRRHAVEKLLSLGDGGKAIVIHYCIKQLDSEDIEMRKYAVGQLLTLGSDAESIVEKRILGKNIDWITKYIGDFESESLDSPLAPFTPSADIGSGPTVDILGTIWPYGKFEIWYNKQNVAVRIRLYNPDKITEVLTEEEVRLFDFQPRK